ncbi:MAG TPA: biotin/lipoyl-binding protein [Jatrophihabitans sp.]|nr:biotin/lipoyl-binding protein [Jatrophihabitans sp.]
MRSVWLRIRRRPWVSAAVVLLLVLAGLTTFWWSGRQSSAAPAAASYRLVAATTGTIRQSLSSSGTIEPAVQDQLNFGVSGQVTSVRVNAGQRVAPGTVLATIDSATLRANLAQAQASLASAQAKAAADAGGTATQIAADQASVTAAQGQVNSAQNNLTDANLVSPISGVVAAVNLTVGEQVSGGSSSTGSNSTGSGGSGGSGGSAGGQSGAGGGFGGGNSGTSSSASSSASSTAQVEVISNNSWIVNATVDDTQVGLLAVGDQAEISGTSATGTVYGTVASIGLIASSSSGVAAYPVVVNVTGNPTGLHAGATGTVTMIYKQLYNVLTVPTAAVHVVNGTSVVYEMNGSKQVAHQVTTGLSSAGSTQITAGVTAGTQVVVQLPKVSGRTGSSGNSGTGRTGRFGFGGGGFGGGGAGFGGGGFGGGAGGARTGGARTGGGG